MNYQALPALSFQFIEEWALTKKLAVYILYSSLEYIRDNNELNRCFCGDFFCSMID